MDNQQFDDLARSLVTRLPRRGLGPLAAGLLAVVGISTGEAKKARGRKPGKKRHRDNDAAAHQDDAHRDGRNQSDEQRRSKERHKKGRASAAGKKKPKCVGLGASCKKPKKGKAKKCCPGLSCDATTSQCISVGGTSSPPPPPDGGAPSPPPPPGGGGSTPLACPDCAARCRTCDLDETGCTEGCAEAACAAIQRTCQATGVGSAARQLADHLGSLGFVPRSESRGAVIRENGIVGEGVVETEFTGNGSSALLRTVANDQGVAMSVALVLRGNGTLDHALYIDTNGVIARINPEDVATEDGTGVQRRATLGIDSDPCLWCTKTCNLVGANAVCGLVGNFCAAKITAGGFWGMVAALALCSVGASIICQASGVVTCDKFCKGICDPPTCPGGDQNDCLGACCEPTRCERCIDGACQGCAEFTEHCEEVPLDEGVFYSCVACPTCAADHPGVCGIFDDPADCPRLFCDGPCTAGPNARCVSGRCNCEPDTCFAQGRVCGELDDGCGQTVQCGNCPFGNICTSDGRCVGPCEQPGHTCRWVGTVTQHHAFHGETPFDGGTSTKYETRDASYTYNADGTITVVSSEQGHVHTDDPTICSHLIEDTRWQVSGHTEEIEGSISCGRPGSDVCEFSTPNIYRPFPIQVCTTMDSGANSNCGEPGCIEQTRNGVASIEPFSLGAPITTTLSGSWADTQNVCGAGYCGPNTIERSWNLTYTQVD